MADKRKQYEVDINGVPHTMLLEPEDAESLYGDRARQVKAAAAPQNKAGAPAHDKA